MINRELARQAGRWMRRKVEKQVADHSVTMKSCQLKSGISSTFKLNVIFIIIIH